ncbi:ATP-binding cassette domain-containing protein [Lactobacillus sp. DCY120]|uniref:ATP-binding cassette domain-containing protein n=1 Tax=Bombilactobacillus apium TaxID=2675299 RepID=A0A850RBE2_9LACO|nr:ATP-binding cassette domain-containing protein [Bombilactobacillus apium]NVY96118.1 ATP-binding cassette domain-containing protein [Bombilactobacillus apium]
MTEAILKLEEVSTLVNRGTAQETQILKNLDLTIQAGDFITVVGTNGAGKSTLFNVLAGNLRVDAGHLKHNGQDITRMSEEQRTHFLSRVFQDPKLGTAPRMTVAENLLLAEKRGQHRFLKPRHLKSRLAEFAQLTAVMHNGLEERLLTPTEELSGGQRQALSFLMATLKRPDILLLDEHTAALDPKTSAQLMQTTNERIQKEHLTALMITHQIDDALQYGNRLLVLKDGQIIADLQGEAKQKLRREELVQYFA